MACITYIKSTRKFSLPVLLALMAIALTGCKKEKQANPSDELIITLPPGQVHISAQWVEGKIWIESFDPLTNACLLRQYDTTGKVVEGSIKVRLRACRMEAPKPKDEAKKDEARKEGADKESAVKESKTAPAVKK